MKHPEGILVIAGVTCPIYKNAVRGDRHNTQRSKLHAIKQKEEKMRSVPESQSIKRYIQRPHFPSQGKTHLFDHVRLEKHEQATSEGEKGSQGSTEEGLLVNAKGTTGTAVAVAVT